MNDSDLYGQGNDVVGVDSGYYDDGSMGSQSGLLSDVGDTVYFGYDSSSLNSEAQAVLSAQAAWLVENPASSIVIEGHCDERGTREYNIALGERRANAVRNFLVRSGVDSNSVTTVSYGKERPVVVGTSAESYAQNRRARTIMN